MKIQRIIQNIGLLILWTSVHAADKPHLVTPAELARTFTLNAHPSETIRGCDAIWADLSIVGRNIGTSSALTKLMYGEAVKVFHQHTIGSSFVELELLPGRPDFVREGMFSDTMPQKSFGFVNFTTGRNTPQPPHLKPDVTGLTVVLNMDKNPVVLTTTAAHGAFGDTGKQFSELAWWPTLATSALAGYSKKELMAVREPNWKWDERKANSSRTKLGRFFGEQIGEGIFIARNPGPGAKTLFPAILSGRRSSLVGYSGWFGKGENTGFGSGHAYLLNSVNPEKLASGAIAAQDRTAFRFGFRLANVSENAEVKNPPSLGKTVARAVGIGQKADPQYLSTDFRKLNSDGKIVYEMYVQLEDKDDPSKTPIEKASQKWKSEKIPVARMTLLPSRPGSDEVLADLIKRVPANPGLGFHRPLGVLGMDRSLGAVVSRDGSKQSGAYATSAEARGALGFDEGRFKLEPIQRALEDMLLTMKGLGYDVGENIPQ